MQTNVIRKLKILLFICFFTCFAGVIYQLISEESLNYNCILFGLTLGICFGFLELFLFPKAQQKFRRWPFTKITLFKTVFYTAIIYMVIILLNIIAGLIAGRKMYELVILLRTAAPLILVLYTLVVYGFILIFLQINRLLGEGTLWKLIRGKYHKPQEEERIFMFLDMKSSTMIAEQLGHVRFYKLLNEIFHEISQPVLQTKAEIYQYIGDEVVLTWKVEQGLENSNCLKAFFLFRENLVKNSENYLNKFGVKPEFKAGLHFGKVISAQIGDLKRGIVYNGDVLNTASRIQNECNKHKKDFLVSGILKNRLKEINGFQWERLEPVALKGKENKIELFSVINSHSNNDPALIFQP